MNDKLTQALKIVKEFVSSEFEKTSWIYKDYYIDNRFMEEIQSDKEINIDKMDAQEIAEYAIDKINDASFNAKLIMSQF